MDEEVPTARALALVDAVITFFSNNAEPGERLGDLIDRITLKKIRAATGAAISGN
jgi:dissimilatory sulfite reductase (desulfoviridin) alpha/beta subunit